jgi:xylan 1,4-beta-xylosidase
VDERHEFDSPALPDPFQWLRTPYPEQLFSLTDRPGYLRLFGRESIGSRFTQSLVARRQQAFRYTAETAVEFAPANFQQAAGLICYYNSSKYYFLQIALADTGERQVQLLSAIPGGEECGSVVETAPAPPGTIALRVEVHDETARFAFRSVESEEWCWLRGSFDASILSDEATRPGFPNFTGAFVGMACYDLSGARMPADFAYFHYRETD